MAIEKLVKGKSADEISETEKNLAFAELKTALNQALEAVRAVWTSTAATAATDAATDLSGLAPEIVKAAAERLRNAAEMGDVASLQALAEELKAQSSALVPLCDNIVKLAEDFDFDGIVKLADDLEA